MHRLKEFWDANKCRFNQAAWLRAEDLQINNLVHLHETKTEQSHGSKLDMKLRQSYRVKEIASSLGTYHLTELNGSKLAEWIEGNWVKKFFARRGGKYNEETLLPTREEVKEKETEKEMKKETEEE